MHQGTEIRQQLRNQSLEDILVDSINTVGDRIFPDDMAVIDMLALEQIAKAWQSTHALTFGNCLGFVLLQKVLGVRLVQVPLKPLLDPL